MKRKTLWTLVALGVSALTLAIGHGCSPPRNDNSDAASTGGTAVDTVLPNSPSSDIVAMADAKTASVVYANQIIDHYVSCMGTGKASDRTLAMYEDKKGSISEFGGANTITAPMLMAVTSIAGEICVDLLNQESTVALDQRRILTNIDLAAKDLPNTGLMSDSIRRMARSCWNRNETDEERQILLDELLIAFPSGTTNLSSRHAMLFLCTSVLSSLDALVM
jgi:hypothetical protein